MDCILFPRSFLRLSTQSGVNSIVKLGSCPVHVFRMSLLLNTEEGVCKHPDVTWLRLNYRALGVCSFFTSFYGLLISWHHFGMPASC